MPDFLSAAWIDALDAAVRSSEAMAGLAPTVIEQTVVDVPGAGLVRYRIRVDATGARVTAEDDERADVRLTTDYVTAVAIAQSRENAQSALARGRLQLGGDVDVLIRNAEAFAALADVTGALRAATTYPES